MGSQIVHDWATKPSTAEYQASGIRRGGPFLHAPRVHLQVTFYCSLRSVWFQERHLLSASPLQSIAARVCVCVCVCVCVRACAHACTLQVDQLHHEKLVTLRVRLPNWTSNAASCWPAWNMKMSREAACRVGSREKRAPLTFLWSGFHWQGLLFFHRCFSFFPAADLLLPHLEEQDLFLFLVQLCQQIRIYVHLRQDLFQHLCRAGVFYTWGKSSWERLPGLPPLGWHGGAPTDLPRCSWGWDDGSSANWLWVPTPGSLSKTPLMNLQRATAKMQPC